MIKRGRSVKAINPENQFGFWRINQAKHMGKQKQQLFPLFIISCVLFLLPTGYVLNAVEAEPFQALNRKFSLNGILVSEESEKYAVIFDAGSTGSRVHVFRFDPNMDLLRIGDDFEFYDKTKPGLSSYADDPEAAALSIKPLLLEGQAVVPEDLRPQTPVKLGATAGLRMLKDGASDKILQAVRDLFKNESSLEYKAEWVSILDGSEEGSYMWIAINYLLGKIGEPYSDTIATVDLGGGSVEMTYAISAESAAKAPIFSNEGEAYVQEKYLLGTKYYLYAYSYLYYGQLAARAEIFKVSRNSSNPCILDGYDDFYTYGDVVYKASSPPSGSSFRKCRDVTLKALKVNAPCVHEKCTFNGTWSGGGGAGQKNTYLASFFFDIAKEAGIISPNVTSGSARPIDFKNAARLACVTKYEDVESVFPNIEYEDDIPYVCMDLVYQYSLLVDGFGLDPFKSITLISKINYKNTLIGAAWPLGSAIEAVSSLTNWRMFQ